MDSIPQPKGSLFWSGLNLVVGAAALLLGTIMTASREGERPLGFYLAVSSAAYFGAGTVPFWFPRTAWIFAAATLLLLFVADRLGVPPAVVGTHDPFAPAIYHAVVGAFAIVPILTLIFFRRGSRPPVDPKPSDQP